MDKLDALRYQYLKLVQTKGGVGISYPLHESNVHIVIVNRLDMVNSAIMLLKVRCKYSFHKFLFNTLKRMFSRYHIHI